MPSTSIAELPGAKVCVPIMNSEAESAVTMLEPIVMAGAAVVVSAPTERAEVTSFCTTNVEDAEVTKK